jgi:glycosyltransferase involved in cell wall biosynthesis
MPARFLFGGTEVPSLGGASTALYDLFRRLQEDERRVNLVNLLEEQDLAFFQHTFGDLLGNPQRLPGVATCWLTDDLEAPQPTLAQHIDALDPDVLVGVGYLAAMLFKRAAPSRPTILVTASCQQAQDYIASGGARDAVELAQVLAEPGTPPRLVHRGEEAAVALCDLVVTHSPLTLSLMERFFPRHLGKIYPEAFSFAEWICSGAESSRQMARPFTDRDIDVLFVASDWDRHVKNYPLVEAIAARLHGSAIHVVGDIPRPIRGVTHHGFVESREVLFDLFGRARCVACPSRIDAAPGILFEASVLGCNVVASRNCGNWELCHPDLLVESFGADGFAACITRALTHQHEDRRQAFLARNDYANLVGVLEAFAQPFATLVLS